MQIKKRHTDFIPQKSMDHFTDWVSLPDCFTVRSDVNKNMIAEEDEDKTHAKRWHADVLSSVSHRDIHGVKGSFDQYYSYARMMMHHGFAVEILPIPHHGFIALPGIRVYGGGHPVDIIPHIQYPHGVIGNTLMFEDSDQIEIPFLHTGKYLGKSSFYNTQGFLESPALKMTVPFNPLIETAIEEAKYITSLPDNWDEEGAVVISPLLFEKAAEFLRQYSNFLLIGNFRIQLPAPEINPCKDGTIDLSWRTAHARMLINIRLQDEVFHAFFYGDRYNNKMPIKGNVPLKEFSESLAVWMKYLV